MGEKLNLKNPQNFNQKIQWLKIYDKRPLLTQCTDKYAVRQYIKDKIGEKYLIPLLGVYNSFDEIDFNFLPNQFVIKCNHDCGSVIICKDKAKFDVNSARCKINQCMKINFCTNYPYRENQYKNIVPKIVVEKCISDLSGEETKDYKFFCFNGEPKYSYASIFAIYPPKVTFFDLDWNELEFSSGFEKLEGKIDKPVCFDEMVWVSGILSKDFDFVRVDLYELDGKIYFGELTFTPHGGYYSFNPPQWNKIFGDCLQLSFPKIAVCGKRP
jgi:hypothetical protein